HRAVVGLRGACHQFQKRGFAGAVDAHDAPALAPANLEVEPLIDAPRAIALVHLLQARDVLAGAWRRRKIEIDGLPALRRLDAVDLLELLDPALHLRRV